MPVCIQVAGINFVLFVFFVVRGFFRFHASSRSRVSRIMSTASTLIAAATET